jgi:hypothetical protein
MLNELIGVGSSNEVIFIVNLNERWCHPKEKAKNKNN